MTELTFAKPATGRELATAKQPLSAATGYIDSILLKISGFQTDNKIGSLCLGVTSCDRKVGVSTLAHNLALNAGSVGLNGVLVLDANYVDPIQHQLFRINRGPGVVDHLVRGEPIENCLHSFNNGQVSVMMWGSNRVPLSAVSPLKLDGFFSELRTRYQMIVVDMPAIRESDYGTLLASHTDGILLVLDGNRTKQRAVKRCVSALEQHNATIIGTIMNKYHSPVPRWLKGWF
ncbi:MAG: CpsD/CapB family tyrosine-protein kinase [Pirellula sp.]|jgi:Mrp family chromosome partitioning ATPase|nr:CpsD/CapB family tyrosine-protein kinase [Pirellula sp.]